MKDESVKDRQVIIYFEIKFDNGSDEIEEAFILKVLKIEQI
jgi:hypothetical protein